MSAKNSMTINGELTHYLEFGEDSTHTDLRRTLSFGSNWYAIRLGFMAQCVRNVNTAFTAFDAAWGLCSGTSNPYSSATCANFLGYQFGTTVGGANFTPASIGGATGKYYFPAAGTNSNQFVHKHNTTRTFTAQTGAAGGTPEMNTMVTGSTDFDRALFFLEIRKPLGSAGAVGTNYQIACVNVGNNVDFFRGRTPSNALFWEFMNSSVSLGGATTSNYLGVAVSSSALTNVAAATIDEPTNGVLDSFNIHWNAQSATNALRIHQVAVKRLL